MFIAFLLFAKKTTFSFVFLFPTEWWFFIDTREAISGEFEKKVYLTLLATVYLIAF